MHAVSKTGVTMKIYVCVKHVPDSAAALTVIDGNRIDERITFIINPYDEHAITEACRIRDLLGDSEVVAVCLGKEAARDILRSAMAMGADRSILIRTDRSHDPIDTAAALKSAIETDGKPDIVFTGREAIDSNGMQTMFRLGDLFGFPVMTNVVKVAIGKESAAVVSEGEKGRRLRYTVTIPCVLAAAKGLNKPKYPTMPDIIKSRKKEIKTVDYDLLGVQTPPSATEVIRLTPVKENRTPKRLQGDSAKVAEQIIDILKNEAKVL